MSKFVNQELVNSTIMRALAIIKIGQNRFEHHYDITVILSKYYQVSTKKKISRWNEERK